MIVYSSAIQNLKISQPLIPYTGDLQLGNGRAFLYNIESGYSREFDRCDILYSEPAWRAGYLKFFAKSRQRATDFENYVKNICSFINTANKPYIIITGASDSKLYQKYLPSFCSDITLDIHNCKAKALYGNGLDIGGVSGTDRLIDKLSSDFNCVGDFCCGYGNTLFKFKEKEKGFVGSDIIPECISYIKKQYEDIYG